MTTSPGTHLHPADAAELIELLGFLDDWLASGGDQLHESMTRFVGNPAYGISHLRLDLAPPSCSARTTASSSSDASKPPASPAELT